MKSFVSVNEVNELCEALILDFMKSTKHICVDIEGFIADYLNLNIVYIPFAETDTSKFGFLSDGKQGLWVYRNKKKEYVVFPKYISVVLKHQNVIGWFRSGWCLQKIKDFL